MRLLVSIAVVTAALGIGSIVQAQAPGPQVPTTVQLPTFSTFSVQTTVSVPDRGGTFLGGIGRGRDSAFTRGLGPLRNRGLASERGASGMSVRATIIDHDEMDKALLAEAAARRSGASAAPAATKAASLSRHVGDSDSTVASTATGPSISAGRPPATSVAAIRQQNAAAAQERTSEAAEYLAKAEKAQAEGKPGVAKIYYQMVIRRDGGALKQQAQSRLAALSEAQSARQR